MGMFSDPSNQAKAFAAIFVQQVTDKSHRQLPSEVLDLILTAVAEDVEVQHRHTPRASGASPASGDRRMSDRRNSNADRSGPSPLFPL